MKALADLEGRLAGRLLGELRLDAATRNLYSTDASNHEVTPLGVVYPANAEDLQSVVEAAAAVGVPVLPRGAGTSLTGSSLGEALIIDCTRHLKAVHGIDREAGTAVVDPGVVCAQLNLAAAEAGLQYGPDPASADRATFGGMIGTNATGAHSIRYGMTADHVLSLDVVLADGSRTRFEPVEEAHARRKAQQSDLEGRIYRRSLELRERYRETVERDWPRTWRRASGYSLNYLTGYSASEPPAWYRAPETYPPPDRFNLAPVLCGSEGTLAIVERAELRLVLRPQHTVLVVLGFENTAEACDRTLVLLETEPSAIELIPRTLIQQARSVPAYATRLGFVEGDPAALLVVEYAGEAREELLTRAGEIGGKVLANSDEQADLWAVRKAGLGLLLTVPGPEKPVTFMEDVSVPVERLSEYVREVDRLLAEHGTRGEWYAHASAGCLHMRPLIDLKSEQGRASVRTIADEVTELVVTLRGSISGEHGDGLSHTEYNGRLFGPDLTRAFAELKRAFDPENLLNPGKVVPLAKAPGGVDTQLRYGPDYSASEPQTFFAYAAEGSMVNAVEACTGVGICRKADGVMCPSFQVTQLEADSTRGRANALRAGITGKLPATSRETLEVLDLCLECKGCKSECPSKVDLARLKADFLWRYQRDHGVPLRSRLFGELAWLFERGRPFAGAFNWATRTDWFRSAQERALGISRHRTLPELRSRGVRSQITTRVDAPPVVLFVDTYSEFNAPEAALDAVYVLEAAGYGVIVENQQVCCGRPMISKGLLDRARAHAERNVRALAPYANAGIPVVGLEPSCLLALRDEYLEMLPDDPDATAVAARAMLIEEFLTENDRLTGLRFEEAGSEVYFHNHCHSKALVGSGPLRAMLEATGRETREIQSGCCGMAGSFGYESEHYAMSMQIGELVLFPAVRTAPGDAVVAAPGVSCRTQITDGTGRSAVHPISVVAGSLRP